MPHISLRRYNKILSAKRDLFVCAFVSGCFQFKQRIREFGIFSFVVLFACFYAERVYQVGPFTSCSICSKEITVFRDIFADYERSYSWLEKVNSSAELNSTYV